MYRRSGREFRSWISSSSLVRSERTLAVPGKAGVQGNPAAHASRDYSWIRRQPSKAADSADADKSTIVYLVVEAASAAASAVPANQPSLQRCILVKGVGRLGSGRQGLVVRHRGDG